jgi:hypothetical protein
MDLRHLTDTCLHNDTLILVQKERELTAKILHHLSEIDRRKLYCDFKCSSLFSYCVDKLGYSESSAQRRIAAARLLTQLPEIEKKIESGELNLTGIGQAIHFFQQEEIKTPEEKKEVLKKIEGLGKKGTEKKLREISGKVETPKVTISLSEETIKELQKLKDLMGSTESFDQLIHSLTKQAVQKVEKEKFKQVQTPRKPSPAAVESRVPVAEVKREVYLRDNKCCTNCGSTRNLNYDHVRPHALGGKSDAHNIRLLCFSCNQRARVRMRL